jgi:hypothetical protein
MNAAVVPLYLAEFPEFDRKAEAEKLLANGFTDASWHNNCGPSFTKESGRGTNWEVYFDEMESGKILLGEYTEDGPVCDDHQEFDTLDEVLARMAEVVAMSFDDFVATRTECDDIGKAINAEFLDAEGKERIVRGFLYLGVLYIERGDDGRYSMLLYRDEEISEDLGLLERKLYAWAGDEGYFQ